MDVSFIFDDLNDAQRQAVSKDPCPMLVLAGAGSGKTRVLTHRIAWLVTALEVSPLSILAVTFTNKAAQEMRHRVERMIGSSMRNMWLGTFHGLSHRLLRTHYADAGLSNSFEILDAQDQHRLVRRSLRELNLDEGFWPPRQVQWFINSNKEEGRRPTQLEGSSDNQHQTLTQIYAHYESLCQRFGLVDFAELLLRSLELVQNNEPIRDAYRERFQHILVDEFQDTNTIQYRWLKLLAQPRNSITAVGDDDQSIYGWRGARIENMNLFQKDFPETQILRLEQNYRSTGTILAAANSVIDHNVGRMGKKLWTEDQAGAPIRLYAAFNEIDEARFVLEHLREWVHEGHRRDSIAILYRSNAQSRVFEELLLSEGIPYRVYGGLRFFERAEIKDALAYLRLISNRHSDPSFERVVNVPTRGIGARTATAIREHARASDTSMWAAAVELASKTQIPTRARTSLKYFIDLIEALDASTRDLDLTEQTDIVVQRSGLIDHYRKQHGEKAQTRVENLEELVSAARHFNYDPADDQHPDPLSEFLAHAALEAGEGQAEEWEDCVQLMSLHSAKGLEFPLVFLCGLEEGLFPHQRSIDEPGRLEEERRLCYVGMTRAMVQLFLTWAEVRRLYGRENYTRPSRFLSEISAELVDEVRSSTVLPRATSTPAEALNTVAQTSSPGINLGARVHHAKFGQGTVVSVEGQGEHARVQVRFETAGSKWLVLAYANLDPA